MSEANKGLTSIKLWGRAVWETEGRESHGKARLHTGGKEASQPCPVLLPAGTGLTECSGACFSGSSQQFALSHFRRLHVDRTQGSNFNKTPVMGPATGPVRHSLFAALHELNQVGEKHVPVPFTKAIHVIGDLEGKVRNQPSADQIDWLHEPQRPVLWKKYTFAVKRPMSRSHISCIYSALSLQRFPRVMLGL